MENNKKSRNEYQINYYYKNREQQLLKMRPGPKPVSRELSLAN